MLLSTIRVDKTKSGICFRSYASCQTVVSSKSVEKGSRPSRSSLPTPTPPFPPSVQLPTLFILLLLPILSLDSLDGLSSSNSVFLDFRKFKWPSRHYLNHALRSLATPPGMKQSCQLSGNVRFIFLRSCTSLSDIIYRAGD